MKLLDCLLLPLLPAAGDSAGQVPPPPPPGSSGAPCVSQGASLTLSCLEQPGTYCCQTLICCTTQTYGRASVWLLLLLLLPVTPQQAGSDAAESEVLSMQADARSILHKAHTHTHTRIHS